MTAKKSSGSKSKVASATTSRTGQVGAADTKVTPVQDDGKGNDKAEPVAGLEQSNPPRAEAGSKAAAKEAPARKDHAAGVPRKSMEAKFGPKNPDTAETARRQAAVGGI